MFWTSQKSAQTGFSLVELMASVAIISMLTAMASVKAAEMIANAKRTEAHAMGGVIIALLQAKGLDGGTISQSLISADDFTTGTSCNVANTIGFKIRNCSKANYFYMISDNLSSSPDNWTAYAFEGSAPGGDGRVQNVCTKREFMIRSVNLNFYQKLARNGCSCSSSFVDWTGDGTVDGSDFLRWQQTIGLHKCGWSS